MRPAGWYLIRTKDGWREAFYWNGWNITSGIFIIEVKPLNQQKGGN